MGSCVSSAGGAGPSRAPSTWEKRGWVPSAVEKRANALAAPKADPRGPTILTAKQEEQMKMNTVLEEMPFMRAEDVLRAMGNFVIIDVREAGLKRLEALQREGSWDELLQIGGIEAAVKAMEVHYGPGSEALQERGVRFLGLAAATPSGQAKVTSSGGCKAVIRAMEMPGSLQVASLQIAACKALFHLASNSTPNKVKIAALGGIGAVLKAMSTAPEDARLQQGACACLRMLTPNESNQTRIAAAGGAEAILQAMRQHPNHAELLNEGCWALCHLAYSHQGNQKKMATLGVSEALLKCMEEHASAPSVQEHAMLGLKNMCASNQDNQAIVAQSDGFTIIRNAVERHSEVPSVVEQAMWALRNLVDENEDNMAKFNVLVGAETVKELMKKHSGEPTVQNAGNALMSLLQGSAMVNRSSVRSS